MSVGQDRPLRIDIAGGSIGGLTAAVLLDELGHDVHVFERSSAALEDRGAGIVVLPITERYFTQRDGAIEEAGIGKSDLALTLTNWDYIDKSGDTVSSVATYNRFTSWNTLYGALSGSFPADRYHLSHAVKSVEQVGGQVVLTFANGRRHECDLLVAADGMSSTVRGILSPKTTLDYAGYIAWRGTVKERDLTPDAARAFADAVVYQVLDHSHILAYAIPGDDNSIEPGSRTLNWVWYRNATASELEEIMTDRDGLQRLATMPPGWAQAKFVDELKSEASRVLAPQFADTVRACEEPFAQAIFDMCADRFVHGRIALMGDAAAVARPHVAAGTAKACADAWALRDHLERGGSPDSALHAWDAQQVELARTVAARSRRMGDSAQKDSTMKAGDPEWRFGLFGPEPEQG
jgi:2,6-dihydroxypyridine 3-monooxygenase